MTGQKKQKSIIIVPYNSNWTKRFEDEKNRIHEVMGSHFVTIEHAGSTSIPNLDAKPIIDMFAAVKLLNEPSVYVWGS